MKSLRILFIVFGVCVESYSQCQLNNLLTPFGPGDRTMKIVFKACDLKPEALTITVYYSEQRSQLADNNLSNVAAGVASFNRKNDLGEYEYEFIFPHTDFPTPNRQDKNSISIKSGKTVFTRVSLRTALVVTPVISDIYEFKMPQKLTIGLIGDSYGSGEGAPMEGDYWTNDACHRSANSGQVKAVKQLKDRNRGVAMAYKHVSCSGAEIDEIFEKKQRTVNGEVPIQFEKLKKWLDDNNYDRLDVLVMSVGGNDIGLMGLIKDYLYFPIGDLTTDEEIKDDIDDAIKVYLPEAYRQLNNYIRSNFISSKILITEYPNPLNGANGLACGDFTLDACGSETPFGEKAEYIYARNKVLIPLNNQIKTSATELKWEYVDGPYRSSSFYGICNCDGYFNTLPQSIYEQGDERGAFHPNVEGQRKMYQPFIFDKLSAVLTQIRAEWQLKRAFDLVVYRRVAEEELRQAQAYDLKYRANKEKAAVASSKLRLFKAKVHDKTLLKKQEYYQQIKTGPNVKNVKKRTFQLDKYSVRTLEDN